MRQRDANLTALAAIGPRKKRKLDSPGGSAAGAEVGRHGDAGVSTLLRWWVLGGLTSKRPFVLCLGQKHAHQTLLLLVCVCVWVCACVRERE